MGKFIIRKATIHDIKEIEQMYQCVIKYQDEHQMHQWNEDEVTWETLSKTYSIDDYFVGEVDGVIVSGLFIVNVDTLYWPDKLKDDALYLHKICVHPNYRGKGYGDKMITFFKEEGRRRGYTCVRLDVRAKKKPLRQMYERNGFVFVKCGEFVEGLITALYEYVL